MKNLDGSGDMFHIQIKSVNAINNLDEEEVLKLVQEIKEGKVH